MVPQYSDARRSSCSGTAVERYDPVLRVRPWTRDTAVGTNLLSTKATLSKSSIVSCSEEAISAASMWAYAVGRSSDDTSACNRNASRRCLRMSEIEYTLDLEANHWPVLVQQ